MELLGSYNPHKNDLKVDGEKVKDWLAKGAKMSETVNNLLVDRKIIEGEKVKVWKPKTPEAQKKTKVTEKQKSKAEEINTEQSASVTPTI